jgi:A/G-specific adenine glycosylase
LLHKKNPGLHNQAIMEFGALQCVPKNPMCNKCPLQSSCYAFINKKIEELPIKSKKIKNRVRYFNYLVLKKSETTFIKRRISGDIWEGLYEFPLIESNKEMDEKDLLNSQEFNMLINNRKFQIAKISKLFKHQLTHQTIFCRFFEIKINNLTNIIGFEHVIWAKLDMYPKPILIQKYYSIY